MLNETTVRVSIKKFTALQCALYKLNLPLRVEAIDANGNVFFTATARTNHLGLYDFENGLFVGTPRYPSKVRFSRQEEKPLLLDFEDFVSTFA